jgi:hypothetical protein
MKTIRRFAGGSKLFERRLVDVDRDNLRTGIQ